MSIDTTPNRPRTAIALLSHRRRTLCPRLEFAEIAASHVPLPCPLDPTPPKLETPLLLDTMGMPPPELTDLLTRLSPRLHRVIALIAPNDRVALRLCALCAAIPLLVSDAIDLMLLRPWLVHFGDVERAQTLRQPFRIGLPDPTRPLLDPMLLPTLAALHHAPSLAAVAEQTGQSEATLKRLLQRTRAALALPCGTTKRFAPQALATAIYTALKETGEDAQSSS